MDFVLNSSEQSHHMANLLSSGTGYDIKYLFYGLKTHISCHYLSFSHSKLYNTPYIGLWKLLAKNLLENFVASDYLLKGGRAILVFFSTCVKNDICLQRSSESVYPMHRLFWNLLKSSFYVDFAIVFQPIQTHNVRNMCTDVKKTVE